MSEANLDFPPSSAADWRALVAKTLGDKPFESLSSTTAENLTIAPLYPSAGSPPLGFRPRTVDADRQWDVRTVVAHPDPAIANAEILRDLEGGAASVLVRLDPTGETGAAVGSADDLARVLSQVVLELAPVALDAGFLGVRAADWLGAVAKASPGAKLRLNLDPLSAFAEAGASPGPVESHMVACAVAAVRLSDTYPQATLFLASGRVVHEAGGGEAGELAFALAAALAYAKALVRADMPMDRAFGAISLGLSADTDYFLSIAKLRAARVLWARLVAACGVDSAAVVEARASHRMLTVQDPWTNMLRLTAAGFAAAVGGADSVALGCFTDAIGLPTEFARRQSRNTQLVLMEEAHIARVFDPAAGAGYIETLTEELARAAWAAFQAIEAAGGAIAALESGHIAAEVAQAKAARASAGEPRIVGVTAFPPDKSAQVAVETPAAHAVDAPSPRVPGPDSACPPLKPLRLAQPYEVQ
ncbi:methylmalonyl-CoA mutase family protein [Phenylobacterium sp.]|uniref:methylmalonyl-CoA mutase family protein n=1 Tax=Phenylobacterium sp. TaxID=1871053 RepID=UPI0027359BC9|nr:methylmalonyl-CoA mutase family protein [Phenylobacterium sp.]MDP3660142.1 methylmalonyl-CoA mutase family protein [Phenylobacterium sp.]